MTLLDSAFNPYKIVQDKVSTVEARDGTLFWEEFDSDGLIGDVFFEISPTMTVYDRQVFGILDLLGAIGGFSTVIFAFGGFLVSLYVNTDLELSLMSQAFKVKLNK